DDAPLVLGQAGRVFPQADVAAHVDFLRHPVVGAGGEIFLPGPLVLEGHQLVDVGLGVDDALVLGRDAAEGVAGVEAAVGRLGGGQKAALRLGREVFELQHGRAICPVSCAAP